VGELFYPLQGIGGWLVIHVIEHSNPEKVRKEFDQPNFSEL
jgi:hypothetical protein